MQSKQKAFKTKPKIPSRNDIKSVAGMKCKFSKICHWAHRSLSHDMKCIVLKCDNASQQCKSWELQVFSSHATHVLLFLRQLLLYLGQLQYLPNYIFGLSVYYKAYSIVLKLQVILPEYVTENLMGELIYIVFGFTESWNQFSRTTAPYRLEFAGLSSWTHGFIRHSTGLYKHTLSLPVLRLQLPASVLHNRK